MLHHSLRLTFVIAVFGLAVEVQAGLLPTGPFAGAIQESYETFPGGTINSPINVFGGEATLSNASQLLFIYGPGNSFGLVGNGTAQPFDGDQGLGINGPSGNPTEITFDVAVTEFGGYWSHSTLGVNRIDWEFYNVAGQLIDVDSGSVADPSGNLHWFGWASTEPIKRVVYDGRFVVNDYLQANPIPSPGALLAMALAGLTTRRRRR